MAATLHVIHTVLILHWHVDPILVHIYSKTQPTTASTSHDIVIYVSQYVHQIDIFDGNIWGIYVHTCALYEVTGINHLTWTTVYC